MQLPSFETVVVDNSSTDGSPGWLSDSWGGRVRLVTLPENLGFAGGNNEGIRASRGRYVVLLNNDTAADPRGLEVLAAAVERHPDTGMFTPKILNYYRRDEIDNTGHIIYPDGLASSWNAGSCCGTSAATGVNDVGFLRAVAADLAMRLCVDPGRLYATGMSNGGYMSHRLACETNDRSRHSRRSPAPWASMDARRAGQCRSWPITGQNNFSWTCLL